MTSPVSSSGLSTGDIIEQLKLDGVWKTLGAFHGYGSGTSLYLEPGSHEAIVKKKSGGDPVEMVVETTAIAAADDSPFSTTSYTDRFPALSKLGRVKIL